MYSKVRILPDVIQHDKRTVKKERTQGRERERECQPQHLSYFPNRAYHSLDINNVVFPIFFLPDGILISSIGPVSRYCGARENAGGNKESSFANDGMRMIGDSEKIFQSIVICEGTGKTS